MHLGLGTRDGCGSVSLNPVHALGSTDDQVVNQRLARARLAVLEDFVYHPRVFDIQVTLHIVHVLGTVGLTVF